MATEGHAPTRSMMGARELWLIGQGTCPHCEFDLKPGKKGGVQCPECDFNFPIGGGGRQ